MYCLLIDSNRPHYIPFLKFLLENKPNIFEIVEYSDINSIDWSDLKKYEYVIWLNRFCYVNFAKIIDYCQNNKPVFAGLSTYWGIGFPYVAILSKNIVEIISDNINIFKAYLDDPVENIYINALLLVLQLEDIKDLLSKTETELQQEFSEKNLLTLDQYCYLNNVDYTMGTFHNSIFVNFNDADDHFIDFIVEYHSGRKFIKYLNKPYRLKIGEQFFVVKHHHVGILNNQTLVVWNRDSMSWKKAGPKLTAKITAHITKNFGIPLDLSNGS